MSRPKNKFQDFLLWVELRLTAYLHPIFKPWARAILLCAGIVLMWFWLGWTTSWSFYDRWSGIFDWIKPDQALDIVMILVTIQVPFLIFGIGQIINAGYATREVFNQVLPFRAAMLGTVLSAILIYLSPRASFVVLPFLLIIFMTGIIIFFATSAAIQKRQYKKIVSEYVHHIAEEASKQIFSYRSRHSDILRHICGSALLGLSDITPATLDDTSRPLRIGKNKLLYDINLGMLEKLLSNDKLLAHYSVDKNRLVELDWRDKRIIPQDWEIQHNKQPKLLLDYKLLQSLSFSWICDNRQDFTYASAKLGTKNTDTKAAKKLIKQIEKAFHYDSHKTYRLNDFWLFEDILDELEDGLKEHLGDRNTVAYEELLGWLKVLIQAVDKTGMRMSLKLGNYEQVQHEYSSTGQYYEAIYSRPTEILIDQLKRIIDGDLSPYFRIFMQTLRGMLDLDLKTGDFPPQITSLRGMHLLQSSMSHCLDKPKVNSDYLYFLIATLEFQSRTFVQKTQLIEDPRTDFIFKLFFVDTTFQILLMRGMCFNGVALKEKDIHRLIKEIIKLWQNYNYYGPNTDANEALLFKARCYIYTIVCQSEYIGLGLFPIRDLLFQSGYPWRETDIVDKITHIALECYTNKEYMLPLRLNRPLGKSKTGVRSFGIDAEEAVRLLWVDLVLLQDNMPAEITDFTNRELTQEEKNFFIGQYDDYSDETTANILLHLLEQRLVGCEDTAKVGKMEALRKVITRLIAEYS